MKKQELHAALCVWAGYLSFLPASEPAPFLFPQVSSKQGVHCVEFQGVTGPLPWPRDAVVDALARVLAKLHAKSPIARAVVTV